MARSRSLASVVVVGFVAVVFVFVVGLDRPAERSAYDVGHERTVSIQAFIDAAPPGWSVLRSRRPPPGGGPLFIASIELPDPCREVAETMACDALPPIDLPPGGVAIRVETARELLVPAALVTAPPVGDDLVVNGYRTKLVRVVGGPCFAGAADETITVVIPTLGDWIGRTTVVACLRGPGLAGLEAEVLAFLERAAR